MQNHANTCKYNLFFCKKYTTKTCGGNKKLLEIRNSPQLPADQVLPRRSAELWDHSLLACFRKTQARAALNATGSLHCGQNPMSAAGQQMRPLIADA